MIRIIHAKHVLLSILIIQNAWGRAPTSIEEALKCMVFVTNFDNSGQPASFGSGMIIQEGGTQWIYTNAHVIEGANRIEFVDVEGVAIKDFGKFACFAKGSGCGELESGKTKIRFGGDGVRIELKKQREVALEIAGGGEGAIYHNMPVITIGDNDGDKSMDVLEGNITALGKGIVQSNCKTRPGASGGALLAKDSFKVIGLHSWGIESKTNIKDAIWQDDTAENKVAGASVLNLVKWTEIKPADFLSGSIEAMKFRDTVRMLFLIYSLTPQETGFTFDYGNTVAANITFEQAFSRYENDPVLRPVIDLNQRLAGRDGKIGTNNMELVKIYARALTDIRASYSKKRRDLPKKLAPYFLIDFEQSGFYEVGDWCNDGLLDAQSWFESKSKLGGTMPVGIWFNLKPLSELGNEYNVK